MCLGTTICALVYSTQFPNYQVYFVGTALSLVGRGHVPENVRALSNTSYGTAMVRSLLGCQLEPQQGSKLPPLVMSRHDPCYLMDQLQSLKAVLRQHTQAAASDPAFVSVILLLLPNRP